MPEYTDDRPVSVVPPREQRITGVLPHQRRRPPARPGGHHSLGADPSSVTCCAV